MSDMSIDDAVSAAITAHAHRPGALLPVLHAIQDRIGHVPPEAVPVIAKALNLSRAEVHGVISFYHHFRSSPAGRHLIRIGRVVFLDVSPAEAARRLGRGQVQARPLAGQWTELLRARLPMDRRAPITVDVDALSPDAVARRVAAILGSST